jgi:hypothetical protein
VTDAILGRGCWSLQNKNVFQLAAVAICGVAIGV